MYLSFWGFHNIILAKSIVLSALDTPDPTLLQMFGENFVNMEQPVNFVQVLTTILWSD